jgi:glucose-1-phosphate thymidylyltransferase
MLAGIKEILIISNQEYIENYRDIFGDGSQLGLRLEYKIQPSPDGLAEAFLLGEEFLAGDNACLILGDNIFYGNALSLLLTNSIKRAKEENKATVFGYYVKDPKRYGVAEFDIQGRVISIEEKPKNPKSNYAVVGLYFYPSDVVQKAKLVKPSDRGELEITTLNQIYLDESRLSVELMGRGYTWLDTGTHESLLEASQFIQTIEKRQGLKVACLEEIAYEMGYITKEEVLKLAESLKKNQYGQYLIKRANESKIER